MSDEITEDEPTTPPPPPPDPAAKEAAQYRRKLREAEARIADMEARHSKALEDAVRAARAEAQSSADARIAEVSRSKRILANAFGKLADPADAEKFLDLAALGDDPSDDQIAKALDELVAAKSYLRPQSGLGRDTGSGVRESIGVAGSGNPWFDKERQNIR